MARVHKWYYLRDGNGRTIAGSSLKLYKTNTKDEATIYSTPVSAANDLIDQSTWTTNTSGFFDFFIGNVFEELPLVGYIADQFFDLYWQAPAGPSGALYNLQLLPLVFRVDELDTNEVENKLVNNDLAYTWTNHAQLIYSNNPHGIEPVDVNDSSDITPNKAVSDDLLYTIDRDLTTLLICGGDAISITASGSLIYNYTLMPAGMIPSAGDNYPKAGGSNVTTWVQTVTHAIPRNVKYPLITVYNVDDGEKIMPVEIVHVDLENIRIEVADETSEYNVTVIGEIGTPSQTEYSLPAFVRQVEADADDGANLGGSYVNYFDRDPFGQNAGELDAGLRFDNVNIPKDATILSAHVTFKCYYNLGPGGNTCNINVHIEDSDDPVAVANIVDWYARVNNLGAAVAWNAVPLWTSGNSYDSIDISTILETHLARAGWVSGQALMVYFMENGSSAGAFRQWRSHKYLTGADAPILTVNYSV